MVTLLLMSQKLIMPLSTEFDDSPVAAEQLLPRCVLASNPGPWVLSGSGVFSWSVFRFYKASLFRQAPVDKGGVFALQLEYLRRVTAQQIADTSVQEMQRLEFGDEKRLQAWAQRLVEILPDVSLGDRLVGVFFPGSKVEFFSADKMLGAVEDSVFAEAFAAIWLDPRTKGQALRKALLGLAS